MATMVLLLGADREIDGDAVAIGHVPSGGVDETLMHYRAAVPLKPARGSAAANAADLKIADRLTTGQEVDRLTVAYPVVRVD
jgi:hypothetical protein